MVFVLVHSPLAGPATWDGVAKVLRASGHDVLVPDLTGVASAPRPRWRYCVDVITTAVKARSDLVLVAHSGAGLLVPVCVYELQGAVTWCVFVDATLPPSGCDSTLAAEPEFRAQLDELALGGVLPPWSTWFGPGLMEHLVVDPVSRGRIEEGLPCLPLDYFDDPILVPAGWDDDVGCVFVQLSDLYADRTADARTRGWPAIVVEGGHLHMVNDPVGVAATLGAVVRA